MLEIDPGELRSFSVSMSLDFCGQSKGRGTNSLVFRDLNAKPKTPSKG